MLSTLIFLKKFKLKLIILVLNDLLLKNNNFKY